MRRLLGALLGFCAILASIGVAAAQEQPSMQPPKLLVITREYLKPGKMGSTHEKAEGAFVRAFERAKWPTHYLAMDSLSGKSRSLFLTGYDSFAGWEKDALAVQKDAQLSAALEHAAAADADLLDSTDGHALLYRDEYSLRPGVDLPHMRYFEISLYHVKPGHEKDWDEIVKMVKEAYEKAVPDVHWATYESLYGGPSGTYVVINPIKSGAEIDKDLASDKDFESAMGEDGMKRLGELSAAAIDSSESNLFVLNPRMSYVGEDWIKADDFWKPKPMGMPGVMKKKPAEKEKAPAAQ